MNIKTLPEVLLKRFLYLSSEDLRYVSGNPEIHDRFNKKNLTACEELLKENKNDLTVIRNVFEVANNEKLLPRRASIFFALATCVTSESVTNAVRHEIYTLVLNLCKNDDDFFSFIKFCTKARKSFPSGLNKIVAAYYFKKDPLELAKNISVTNSHHGWKHKDVIKLSHCKTDDTVMETILTYILYGIDKAKAVANDDKETVQILDYICKMKEFRSCNDEKKVAQMLLELKITHILQIPSSLNKSPIVWEALIPQLPLNELINCLPKLYKLGFLKQSTNIHAKLLEVLCDGERIKTSKIHPAEVFIGLRNIEKGGKPKDPKLVKYLETKEAASNKSSDPDYKKPDFAHQEPAKCPAIISALHKTLNGSYNNLRSTGKRIMVTVDVGSNMSDPCLTTKNLTGLEAAALTALSLLKVEKNLVLAVFNGASISPVSLEKSATLNQAIRKLKEARNDSVSLSSVFEWAINKNKAFDVFINIFFDFSSLTKGSLKDTDKVKELFGTYKAKLSLPETRVITYCMGMHNLAAANAAANWLDVCGFDKEVPKVIEAYIRGIYQ